MRFLQNRVKTFETFRDRGGDGFSKGRYEAMADIRNTGPRLTAGWARQPMF
jgi:hypothetical protein